MQSRRAHLRSLLGVAALAGMPSAAHAEDRPIPAEGIGHRIKHISYSDIGGRPDSVQLISNRNHLYVGHMFSDGVTILDASDPRRLKPVSFFTAGQYTRTHHLQSSDDLLLVADGANIVAMQSYSDQRGYFENSLADSITKRKNFRSGLSIHDISKPGEMKEIAFLEMPGLGINRRSRHLRPAQSAREPAWLVPERADHFRHLQCRRRARFRHQGPVCAKGAGVLAATRASQIDRPRGPTSRSPPKPPISLSRGRD